MGDTNVFWPFFKALMQGIGLLFSVWQVWVLVLAAMFVKAVPTLLEHWRLSKAGMPEVDRMTGLQFERFLQILFRQMGYSVERTPYVGDYGGDLVLSKPGERIVVQAKRWNRVVGI